MMKSLKKYLLTGLLVWLPLAATAWVLQLLLGAVDQFASMLPSEYRPDYWVLEQLSDYVPRITWLYHLPGFGLLLMLAILLVTGVLAANIFGQRVLRYWEGLLIRIPIVRSIYSSVKQVSDTVFSGSGQAFSKAVLVRFPHADAWTIAFLTGKPSEQIASAIDGEHINVYVPTTPNPTSGYLEILPLARVTATDWSMDEAMTFIISGGVVSPERLHYSRSAPWNNQGEDSDAVHSTSSPPARE